MMLHDGKPGTLKLTASLQSENGWVGKDNPAGPFGVNGLFFRCYVCFMEGNFRQVHRDIVDHISGL